MSKNIKPTKNERIESLEREVDALWAFVVALSARIPAQQSIPYAPPVPLGPPPIYSGPSNTGTPLPDRGRTTSP